MVAKSGHLMVPVLAASSCKPWLMLRVTRRGVRDYSPKTLQLSQGRIYLPAN